MITRTLRHLRGNAVAYVALFFAIGGGGGYAMASTGILSNKTIHECVSKKNGAVYVAKKCTKNTNALVLNLQGLPGKTGKTGTPGVAGAPGPAGTPAVVAFGQVGDNGIAAIQQGMTITPVSTGVYDVTVTAASCAGLGNNVPVLTPYGGPAAAGSETGIPTAWIQPTTTSGTTFVVQSGDIQGGAFVNTEQGFDVQDQC